jgi:glycosyltransferase involved in cell wall biosynthesis
MTRPLSVWLVDPPHLTPWYDAALAGALAAAGANVRFLTCPFRLDESLEDPPGVTVEHHYFRRVGDLAQAKNGLVRRVARAISYPLDHRALVSRAKRDRPDVVHLQWSRLPRFDLGFIKRLQGLGTRVVHTVHDVEPLYRGSGGRSALERVYAACDGLVVHTRANQRELAERYPAIRPERVHVIPHGPLQAETTPPGATRESARAELGLNPTAPVALFFGVIKPYKGLDLLVKAFEKVVETIPEASLLIAGKTDTPADRPDLSLLEKVPGRVSARFDFVPNRDVWKYYLAADLAVLPYRCITQSGVLLSTLAFGRPALVTRVGGLPELIEPDRTGWIVPPEDPGALTAALTEALRDRDRLTRMGSAARAAVEGEYSWANIAEKTLAMYRSL